MTCPLEKLYDCMVTGTLVAMSAATEQQMNKIGLTDDEKEIMKKYSYKLCWCTVLEQYIKNKIALNFKEKTFLKRTVIEAKEADLVIKLGKFLNNTTKDEAKKLQDDIYKGIPCNALEDFCDIVRKFSK